MTFFNKITAMFSGGKTEAPAADAISYKDYTIVAQPIKEGSQFRTAGFIRKEINGETKEVQFIRADMSADFDAAVEHSVGKAKQIVDEQGARVFERDIA